MVLSWGIRIYTTRYDSAKFCEKSPILEKSKTLLKVKESVFVLKFEGALGFDLPLLRHKMKCAALNPHIFSKLCVTFQWKNDRWRHSFSLFHTVSLHKF